MAPSTAGDPPGSVDSAYAPPARESPEGAADLGRRQGAASLVCAPLAVVVLAGTIAVTRATQSTGAGVMGFAAATLVAFAGAAFGISSLLKGEIARGTTRGFSAAVFFAALLNGLLALAGGMLAFALLVVSD